MQIDTPKLKKSFINRVQGIVGENYSIKPLHRLTYARDSNFKSTIRMHYQQSEPLPDIIAWPDRVEQIQKLVQLCSYHKIPIVPFGAGSGVCGGTIPVRGGMVIDVKRLRKILNIDESQMLINVEVGIMSQHLEDELNRRGYTLGHFPSSILCASLGGCLAARSAGQLSSRYGKIEDMVRDLDIVTGRGDLLKTAYVNQIGGVDLNQLFLGSEGTLGLITRATLRFYPLPEKRLFSSFRFTSMDTAIEAVRRISQSGLIPPVVRLYDPLDTLLIFSKKQDGPTRGVQRLNHLIKMIENGLLRSSLLIPKTFQLINKLSPWGSLVIFMHEGLPELAKFERSFVHQICNDLGGKDLGEDPGHQWYRHRYSVSFKASSIFASGAFTDTIEVATTWDSLPELYTRMVRALSSQALVMAHLSHVYPDGGALYFTVVAPLIGLRYTEGLYDRIWDRAMHVCQKMGAVLSHHHGIGRLKAKYMKDEVGEGMVIYRAFKDLFDPHGIMNPGKLMFDQPFRKAA